MLVDFASDLFSYCTEVWTKNKTLEAEDTTGNIPSLKEKVKKETDNSVLKSLNTSRFTALQRRSVISNEYFELISFNLIIMEVFLML